MFFSSIMQKIYQVQTHKDLKYITASEIEGTSVIDTNSEYQIEVNKLDDHTNLINKDESNMDNPVPQSNEKKNFWRTSKELNNEYSSLQENITNLKNSKDIMFRLNETIKKLQDMVFRREYYKYTNCDSIRYVLC